MPYYFKVRNCEFGPYEERVIISYLIDGEINSRSLIKSGVDGEYKTINQTDFDAVLPKLTSRWRYNIEALKREFTFLLVSLFVWFIPLLPYLWGLYNPEVMNFLQSNNLLKLSGILSIVGFLSTSYFTWMFAYRCYRVVPKSKYNITPGWRIMLTYIPFFRLGWNYYMWASLTTKLRALTNYTMYTGKVAAVFYATSMIVLTVSSYFSLFSNWTLRIFDLSFDQALWQNVVGSTIVGLLIISFFATVISFVVMISRIKRAALSIIRHRYAYNITNSNIESEFMLTVLKEQRRRDKSRRWGHGLGIAGVLVFWPILLIGIPSLVLLIIGNIRYEKVMDDYRMHGFATEFKENSNTLTLNFDEKDPVVFDKELRAFMQESSSFEDYSTILNAINSAQTDGVLQKVGDDNLEFYLNFLKANEDKFIESCMEFFPQRFFKTKKFYGKNQDGTINNMFIYLYSKTPLIYFELDEIAENHLALAAMSMHGFDDIDEKILAKHSKITLTLNQEDSIKMIKMLFKAFKQNIRLYHHTEMRLEQALEE